MAAGKLTSADITRKHWMPSEAVHKCCNPQCGCNFNESSRKYQCFSCGNVFCLECANHFMPLDPGTAQFTAGGILARVCSLCLEKGKEEGAFSTGSLPEARPGAASDSTCGSSPTDSQMHEEATASMHSLTQAGSIAALMLAQIDEARSQKNEEPAPGLNVKNTAVEVGASADAPQLSTALDKTEQLGRTHRERATSAAAEVTLESFSFKDRLSEVRPEVSITASSKSIPAIDSSAVKGTPPNAQRADAQNLSAEGSAEKGIGSSSIAIALDRRNSRQGRKGRTRVVDLYDELLTGEPRGSSESNGAEIGGSLSHSRGSSEGNGAASADMKSAPPLPRATSARGANSHSEAKAVPLPSARLQRSSTRGSGSWLWGTLLGKAPKVDPHMLDTKLSNMTSELQMLRGEVTTAEEQAVTVQAALDHLDNLLRSASLAEYLVIRTRWQSDAASSLPSESAECDGDWLQRFLVLEDETLSYYFRAIDPRPQGTIPLSQVVEAGPLTSSSAASDGEAAVHGFYVATCHGLQLQCASANKFKVELWLTTISEALCQLKASLPPSGVQAYSGSRRIHLRT